MKLEKVIEYWLDDKGVSHEREFLYDDQGRLVETPKPKLEKLEDVLARLKNGAA